MRKNATTKVFRRVRCKPYREFALAGRSNSVPIAGGKLDARGEDNFAGFGATDGQNFHLRVSKSCEAGKMVCCSVEDTWPAVQVDASGDIFAWSQGPRVRASTDAWRMAGSSGTQWEAIILTLQWRQEPCLSLDPGSWEYVPLSNNGNFKTIKRSMLS